MRLDEPKPLVQIGSADSKDYSIKLVPNYGRDILATGRLYTEDLLKITPADHLGVHTSGVLSMIEIIKEFRLLYYIH